MYVWVVEVSRAERVWRSVSWSVWGEGGIIILFLLFGLFFFLGWGREIEERAGGLLPCLSMPFSMASSSSESEGYLNVLRRRCDAMSSAALSFCIALVLGGGSASASARRISTEYSRAARAGGDSEVVKWVALSGGIGIWKLRVGR